MIICGLPVTGVRSRATLGRIFVITSNSGSRGAGGRAIGLQPFNR
jgi:hypothetical protein